MSQGYRAPRVDGDLAFIPLTQGKEAVIDARDLPLVGSVKWCAKRGQRSFYATRSGPRGADGRQPFIQLHRVIMAASPGQNVDHINLNGLDCRRANLRFATMAENSRNRPKQNNNTTGFKGVTLFKGRFQAHIKYERKKIHLGCFATAEEAHAAYADAAARLHGQFARVS